MLTIWKRKDNELIDREGVWVEVWSYRDKKSCPGAALYD